MIIYTRLYSNDPYTVKGELDFGGFYDRTAKNEYNNYVTKCEDRLLRKEVLELFESDKPKKQDKPKGTRIMEGF